MNSELPLKQLADRLEKELYVIAMAYILNQSNKSIAKTMGISPNRVSQIKRKALVRIKNIYRGYNCAK